VRAPADAVRGGRVAFNDRYDWQGTDWAPLGLTAPLSRYADDGTATYWAADIEIDPPRPRYRFGLETDNGTRWLGFDGLADEPRPTGAFEFPYVAEGDLPDAPDWAAGATFYQIFPERFARSPAGHRRGPVDPWDEPVTPKSFLGGDLDGVTEHLDHIASLGVDGIYLTPIFTSPSNHKYDTTDYFNVDPDFGGNAALRRLVSAAHERGMRVVLDGVFNHSGANWPPFVDLLVKRQESEYAGWFYLRKGGSYETFATDIPSMPKLRTSDPALRDELLSVGRFWVEEYGVDGWRLDVAHEIDHAFWRAFRAAVKAVRSDAVFIGETWDWALPWLRGDQFDSFMNYPLRRAILDLARGGDADAFLSAYDAQRATYPEPTHHLLFNLLASHDIDRPMSALASDTGAAGFAAALLFTLPGIAAIYYGDEVGMVGGKEPANRGGMAWDPKRQDARMLALYRELGQLRRELPALRRGAYQRLTADDGLVVFARGEGGDRVVILANAGGGPVSVGASRVADWLGGPAHVLASVGYESSAASLNRQQLNFGGQSVVVVGRRTQGRGND
jgi:cyclomaltodextrinase / maltogenic alpha-amylase / neopullulanase